MRLKMKKNLIILISIIVFGVNVNAKDGQGSCVVNGTNDYASVNFYKGNSGGEGNFVIVYSTSGEKPLASADVTITAEIYWGGWKSVTLYDETVYGILPNQTKNETVSMPKYTDIKNIKVFVKNVVCKSSE